MINRKMMAAACAALMMISMYGCGASSSSQTTGTTGSVVESQTSQTSAADTAGETEAGKITEINGNEVTVALGTLSEDQGPRGQALEQPGENADSSSGSETEMPSGGGQAPGNGGPGGSNFTESGETTTLDLSNATITKAGLNGGETITVDDLSTDDILTWEMDGDTVASVTVKRAGGMGQPGGQMGQSSGEVEQGTAATTIDTDGTYTDETYTSEGDDENALRVDGAAATLDGVTVNKTAGNTSSTENGDFYGMNAGLLATDSADVTIKNATVNTSAQNGNGIFAYGSGTKVSVSDSTIKTTADNSGGIMTTGGASLAASNLTVETDGNSAAAIRSDRGGGTVSVSGGSFTSNGTNSPAVYSTADISV